MTLGIRGVMTTLWSSGQRPSAEHEVLLLMTISRWYDIYDAVKVLCFPGKLVSLSCWCRPQHLRADGGDAVVGTQSISVASRWKF